MIAMPDLKVWFDRACDRLLGELAADEALALEFDHLFLQPEPFRPDEHLVPDFRKDKPFRWK